MAHNLEIQSDGQAAFVAAREPAWHRLGKVYRNARALTVERVLKDLKVGEIIELPVQGTLVTGAGVQVCEDPTKKMTARLRGKELIPLGIVGKDYTVISEAEAFGFLDNIVDTGEANIDAAGLLDGGRRAFACMRIPAEILVGGIDPVEQYLMCAFGHDGSLALTCAVTDIRVVCQNTVTLGLQSATHHWRVRHTSKAVLRVEEARRALEMTHKYQGAWQIEAEKLIATKVSTDRFDQIIMRIYGPKAPEAEWSKTTRTNWDKKRDLLMGLWGEAETNAAIRGTGWGAVNVVTEFEDWFRATRGADDEVARQFQTTLFNNMGDTGGSIDKKNLARTLVLA